jgi:hypothetical protein
MMKTALVLFAVTIGSISGMVVTTSGPAHAVVYCSYIDYPANCVVRPGARLVARPGVRAATVGVGAPVARAAVRHNAGGNLNGGVNRVGVRR